MAENVQTEGFGIPPAGGAPANPGLPPPNMQPGFVPPNPAPAPQGGSFTQADIDKAVAAALASQTQAAPAHQASTQAPLGNPAAALDISDAAESDPLLTSLTNTFSALGNGVDINRAIGNALALGKPELIDNAYIAEKGGAHAEQLKALAASIVGRVGEQTQNTANAVYAAAGDKATWDAAAAAFNQKAPQHLKLVVAKLLESGNTDSVKAGAQMAIDYAKQNGLVPVNAGMVGAGAGVAGTQVLSKAQFQAELRKLNVHGSTFEQDRANLFARRQAGKNQGIN